MSGSTRSFLEAFRRFRIQREFFVYICIGVLTQAIDIGLFAVLVGARFPVEVAATISIVTATAIHFVTNKYLNFRKHDRTVTQQLGTYLAVCAVSFTIQVSLISVLSRVMLLSPLAAKLVGNASSFPLNFLMHRYLTFGHGIRGAFVAWRERTPAPALDDAVAKVTR